MAPNIKPWSRQQAGTYILHNASVIDVAEGITRKSQTVHINNGKITSIKPSAPSLPSHQPGTSIVDCTGLFLCPGLIDSHVHLIAVPGFDQLSSAFGNPESVSLLRQPYVCAQMLQRETAVAHTSLSKRQSKTASSPAHDSS
jgi:imidazolonepropionase-like amidohydrolase